MIDPTLLDDPVEDVAASTVRQFAIIWLLFFGAVAARDIFWRGALVKGVLFAVISVAVPILTAVNLAIAAQLFKALTMLTRPIGEVVSRLLLAVIYFGVFTPLAFVLRLTGHDALARRHRETETYWSEKRQGQDAESYFRQS